MAGRSTRGASSRAAPGAPWLVEHLSRRIWPAVVSAAFLGLSLAYDFRWASVVRHVPSSWISPPDLSTIFAASSSLAHGHIGAIYQNRPTLREFPGILLALAPIGAFSHLFHTAFVQIANSNHLARYPSVLVSNTSTVWNAGTVTPAGAPRSVVYAVQPQWFVVLAPYVVMLSCVSLFALDALAEFLKVSRRRRVALNVAEAVALWPAIVLFGHPEDALAVGLTVYAVIFAIDRRWTRAGWLFGAAVAVQPLVLVVLPVLLAMADRKRIVALVARSLLPGVALTVPPLVFGFHSTVHDLVTAPAYPDTAGTRRTPWTGLAPVIGGKGSNTMIRGGPLRRVPTLGLAVLLWWWVRRLREKPEMIVWVTALALALRSYTELVMTPYYMWPALAVGLVVAGCAGLRRFVGALVLSTIVTVVAQWRLEWVLWWSLVMGLLAVFLAVAVPLWASGSSLAQVGSPGRGQARAERPRPSTIDAKGRSTTKVGAKARGGSAAARPPTATEGAPSKPTSPRARARRSVRG